MGLATTMTEYAIIQYWDNEPDCPALFSDWLPGQIASAREMATAQDIAIGMNAKHGYPTYQQHLKFDVEVNNR